MSLLAFVGAVAGGVFVGTLTGFLIHPVFFQNVSGQQRVKLLRWTIGITVAGMVGTGTAVRWLNAEEAGSAYLIGLASAFLASLGYLELRAIGVLRVLFARLRQHPSTRRVVGDMLCDPRKLSSPADVKATHAVLDDIVGDTTVTSEDDSATSPAQAAGQVPPAPSGGLP